MTAPPSPPNRRRRRIVVLTIAVLVLGLGWWIWPRVDQRFVGTWSTTKGAEFELQGNGLVDSFAATTDRGGGFGSNGVMKWKVRHGHFELLEHDTTVKNWAMNCYYRWQRGERILEPPPDFEADVTEVAGDHFTLRRGNRTYPFQRVTN